MTKEGPELERLLRRLSSCPNELMPNEKGQTSADSIAIVADHMRGMSPDMHPETAAQFKEIQKGTSKENALRAIVCWILHDDWFLARADLALLTWQLLLSPRLAKLATIAKVEHFVMDADRREELARLCLHLLELHPRGESPVHALDRLTSLDSAERDRVLRATAAAERRARQVREAMAKAKAQESASRYGE